MEPDRPLEDREEMEFDDEGNLIMVAHKPAKEKEEAEREPTTEKAPVEESAETTS